MAEAPILAHVRAAVVEGVMPHLADARGLRFARAFSTTAARARYGHGMRSDGRGAA